MTVSITSRKPPTAGGTPRCTATTCWAGAWSVTNPKGAVQKREYDPVGRVVRVLDFDGDGRTPVLHGMDQNLAEYRDNVQHVEYGYSGMWKLTRRRDHRGVVNFRYDREERLRRVINERLQSYEFTLDAVGNVTAEKGSDGAVRRYLRVTGADASSGRCCHRERKGNTAMTPARA